MKKKLTKAILKARGFICTDASKHTEQWVRKISGDQFQVYERPDNVMKDIDLADYTDKEIREFVSGYYKSLEELREQYGKDSNQIIAEIISECTITDSL